MGFLRAAASSPRASLPDAAPAPCECVVGRLSAIARSSPEAIALEDHGRRRTFARLLDDVARVARGLHELGVRPGQRVAVVAGMRTETVVAFHAVLRIGAIAVVHDPESTGRELRRAFEDHAAVLALVDRTALKAVAALPADLHPKAVIAMDEPKEPALRLRSAARVVSPARLLAGLRAGRGDDAARERVIPWALLQASSPLTDDHPCPAPRDLALLQYTVGADGDQLGAMLTHANLVASARAAEGLWGGTADAGAVCLTIPLHETAGAPTALVAPLLAGRALVLAQSPAEVLAAAGRTELGVLASTPAVLRHLSEDAAHSGVVLSAIQRVVVLQRPLEPAHAALWEKVTGSPVLVGYARAECGMAIGGPFDPAHPAALGAPLPGVQVRPGERGGLRIAGKTVFHGYWNRPDETATVLAGDGWVTTGDEVRSPRPSAPAADGDGAGRDRDREGTDDPGRPGMLVLVSRRPPAIHTPDGRAVSPREVAGVLRGHPGVDEVRVCAATLRCGGERIEAEIMPHAGEHVAEEDLLAWAAERLSPAKIPSRVRILTAGGG